MFIDETWIDTACCSKFCWQVPSTQGLGQHMSKGQRLIVVNAGCKDEFIPGAQLIYKASCGSGDYHRAMSEAIFMKGIQQHLLPNFDFPCAIVMDNASYHSTQVDKCPSSNTRNTEIMVLVWQIFLVWQITGIILVNLDLRYIENVLTDFNSAGPLLKATR